MDHSGFDALAREWGSGTRRSVLQLVAGTGLGAMLLQRVMGNPTAMGAREALEIATLGGAAVLGRDDIGALAPGMAADIIAFDLNALGYAGGAVHDPVAALVFCHPQPVDFAVVNGRVLVEAGVPRHIDIPQLVAEHNKAARGLLQRAGLRS